MPGINAPAPEKKTATAMVAVKLVEAAGQPVRPFQDGLDYAFILLPGCGACYPVELPRILVRARLSLRRVYESLQGRSEVGPLPTPRRCHAGWFRQQGSPM